MLNIQLIPHHRWVWKTWRNWWCSLNSCELWNLSLCLCRSRVRKGTGSWKSVWLVYFTPTSAAHHAQCYMALTWSKPVPFMRDVLHQPSPLPNTLAGPGSAETAVSGLSRRACPRWLHSVLRFSPTLSRRRQQTHCWRGQDLTMNSYYHKWGVDK